MSDDYEQPRSSVVWLTLVPIGLLLYLASVGPVARFVRTGGLPRDSVLGTVISLVYWPVEALANVVPIFGELLRWYIDHFLP